MSILGQPPNLEHEQMLWAEGKRYVAGIDEAGRGALAGPVVAAAVVLPNDARCEGVWSMVRDSKLLRPSVREKLETDILAQAVACAIGAASATEVDQIGIAPATRRAMGRAVRNLSVSPAHLLIDWVRLPDVKIAQTSWAKADQGSVSVAAASILAKVWRDRLLIELDTEYPIYGFCQHKGYGTKAHRLALAEHGPCPEHRFTFAPVAQYQGLSDLSRNAASDCLAGEADEAGDSS